MSIPFRKLSAVIVDDNNSTVELLKNIIKMVSLNMEVVASFDNFSNASDYLFKNKPDVLFLNVELFGFNIHEYERLVISKLEDVPIIIIGKNENNDSKKVDMDNILLQLIASQKGNSLFTENYKELVGMKSNVSSVLANKLLVRKLDRLSVIEIESVTYMEADGAYTIMNFLNGEKVKYSKALGIFKKGLETNYNFVEINRSIVINLCHVKDVVRQGKSSYINLSNGLHINISNRTAVSLIRIIEDMIQISFK